MQDWGEFGGELVLVDPCGSAPTSSGSPAFDWSGVWRRCRSSAFLRALAPRGCAIAIAGATLQAGAEQSTAPAEAADVALVLAADVSGSINPEELGLQRQGYARALSDSRVVHAIVAGRQRAALLAYIEWSGSGQQRVIVPWTCIRSDGDARAFAAALLAGPPPMGQLTALGEAIDFSREYLNHAPTTTARRIIDVSGDGANNSGRTPWEARNDAVAAGIVVNGLAIRNETDQEYYAHTHPPGGIAAYFRDQVAGGDGSFVTEAEGFASFAEALVAKLVTEIADARPTKSPLTISE